MARSKNPGISFEVFRDAIKKKQIAPLYFFFGEEDLLLEEALDILERAAIDESMRSFNLDILSGADIDAKDVVSYASMFPMMGERKMVILRDFEKLTGKESLIPYFEKPSATTTLVIIATDADFRLKVFKTLAEKSVMMRFDQLWENEIAHWVKRRIESAGRSVSPDALTLFLTRSSESLREIQGEIEKLYTYLGERKSIEVEDVEAITGITREFNIFELQNAIGGKNISRSMEILDRMLAAGENANGIIAVLTKYFQKLWVLHELRAKRKPETDIIRFMGTAPKYLKDYYVAANNYPAADIEKAFYALIEADRKLKTSGGELNLIMTLLLYNIMKHEPVESFEHIGL